MTENDIAKTDAIGLLWSATALLKALGMACEALPCKEQREALIQLSEEAASRVTAAVEEIREIDKPASKPAG